MAHWQGVLSGALLEVDYEQLVSTPRETVGNLLESLGLVWSSLVQFGDELGMIWGSFGGRLVPVLLLTPF